MELNLLLKYVVFTVLYIEILSFLFNPKIKSQMMMCAVILTAIASISIIFDFKYLSRFKDDGKTYITVSTTCTGPDDICTSFVRLLPYFIRSQNESAPIGWFIGFLGILNMIGMLFLTIIEYAPKLVKTGDDGEDDEKDELSDRIKRNVKIIKSLFISNVVTVFVIGILSYLVFTETGRLHLTIYKHQYDFPTNYANIGTAALVFFMIYLFSSSVYMLHESRMIYKLRVNNLVAK